MNSVPLYSCTCTGSWLVVAWFFFLWGAWGGGHVKYRPGADRCSVAGTGAGWGYRVLFSGGRSLYLENVPVASGVLDC